MSILTDHRQIAGWTGPAGARAECACGIAFDGFDSPADATAALDQHIADQDWWRVAAGAAEDPGRGRRDAGLPEG